jgi:hypothetical protein
MEFYYYNSKRIKTVIKMGKNKRKREFLNDNLNECIVKKILVMHYIQQQKV